MDQISGTTPTGTTPTDAPSQAHDADQPAPAAAGEPGFGSRGRARRRTRFLRKARELAYRDLGGLVYNLHRFGQRNDALVLAKLNTLSHLDGELRALDAALGEREPVTVLREAGITACARCAAIHSSEDRFCPNCGLSMARHVDLPIAAANASPAPPAGAGAPAPAIAPASPAQPQPASAQPQPSVTGAQPAPPAAANTTPPPTRETAAPASAGRSPEPPPRAPAAAPASAPRTLDASVPGEEPTEILRPGAPGA